MKPGKTQHRLEVERMGLWFGLLAGLAFGLAVWGWNALQLWRSAAQPAWLMAGLAILLVVMIAGFVSWLVARLDNAFLAFLLWAVVGVLFGWLVLQSNFSWINGLVDLGRPEFRGLHVFPLEGFIPVFRRVLYVIMGFGGGLAGVFQLYMIEAAVSAGSAAGRAAIVVANLVLFAMIGMVADTLSQRPLREPVIATAYAIREVKSAAAEGREADGMTRRALKVLGERINRPYRLYSGTNDQDSLTSGSVHLDFNGEWAMCNVFDGNLGYCDLSEKIFAGRLGCLLDGGTEWGCMVLVPEEKKTELQAVMAALGNAPQVAVAAQLGDVVLLDLEGSSGARYRCVLRLRGNTYYDGCVETN